MDPDPAVPIEDWAPRFLLTMLGEVGDSGWPDWAPDLTMAIYSAASHGPRPEHDILGYVAEQEALDALDALDDGGDPPAALSEDRIRERAERAAMLARLEQLARDVGVFRLATLADTADFLVAVGVLCRADYEGQTYLLPARFIPLPAERLALTAQEIAAEDARRWKAVFRTEISMILWLLYPADRDQRRTCLETSLAQIARRWEIDVCDVREAMLLLLDEPYATSDTDIARAAAGDRFVLTIDWASYDVTHTRTFPPTSALVAQLARTAANPDGTPPDATAP